MLDLFALIVALLDFRILSRNEYSSCCENP
jgi:hypothetical protein